MITYTVGDEVEFSMPNTEWNHGRINSINHPEWTEANIYTITNYQGPWYRYPKDMRPPEPTIHGNELRLPKET